MHTRIAGEKTLGAKVEAGDKWEAVTHKWSHERVLVRENGRNGRRPLGATRRHRVGTR